VCSKVYLYRSREIINIKLCAIFYVAGYEKYVIVRTVMRILGISIQAQTA
jgi:hypothetical protein